MRLAWVSKGDIHRCCDCGELGAEVVYRGSAGADFLFPLCKPCYASERDHYDKGRILTLEEAQIMVVKSKL